MWRALLFLALFCHAARAQPVSISAHDAALIELDWAAYFSQAEHAADTLLLYMPNDHTCASVIAAQLVPTDNTYRIYDWYYMPAGKTGISTRVSIVDMAAFARRAYDVGVWNGAPDCDTIWLRICMYVIADALKGISYPVGSALSTVKYGLMVSLSCDEATCSAAQLTEVLKVSPPNGVVDLIK